MRLLPSAVDAQRAQMSNEGVRHTLITGDTSLGPATESHESEGATLPVC